MNENDYLKQIAALTGLQYYPLQGPWGRKSGTVIGTRDGYVTTIGFLRSREAKIVILLRFKKVEQPELVKSAVSQGTAVPKKHGKLAEVGSDFLQWEWKYSFTKPKAEDVAQLADTLRESIKTVARGFDARCEHCTSASTQALTLMNGVPIYICAGCQEKVHHELDQAAINYDAIVPNYTNGLALGIGASVLGGVAWGLVAYAINRIFLYGAILIGYFVAGGVLKGTGKVTRFGQLIVPIFTVASVLFGDAIFYTLVVMKHEGAPFSTKLLGAVLSHLWEIEREGNGVLSIIFALVGAGYALYAARKPKFKAAFQPLGMPSA
jgi:hypothetical protein